MAVSESLKNLVAQLPDPDEHGTLSNIDKGKVEQAIAAIHQGGRENVLAIIDLLVEPGKGNDIKPHYALHCLAVYVCQLDDPKHRRAFAEAVASQIGGDRPKLVQKYLIQELQVGAGREVAGTLGKALLDEALCESAAEALVAIGDGAAEPLRAALPKLSGNGRLSVLQALGALADAAAADEMKKALGDENREIRLAAAWGLARIGDAGAVDLLLKAAEKALAATM